MPANLFLNMMTPILALVCWTLFMLAWLYAARIPAMRKAGVDARKIKGRETHGQFAAMPAKVHWVADNYNHLHEQPTLFYALCLYSHIIGVADNLNVTLAWAYVVLRVIHSLVQATTNYVPTRFLLFIASSLVLAIIALRNVWALFVIGAAI